MEVLADFLKTAGVSANIDPSPYSDQIWSHSGENSASSTGYGRLSLVCVAAGEYWLADEQTRMPLTTGDVVFLLQGSPHRLETSQPDSTLVIGSIVFHAGDMALATLGLPRVTIVRGLDHPESKDLALRLASEVLLARGGWQQVAECLATSLFITSRRVSEGVVTMILNVQREAIVFEHHLQSCRR